MQLNTRLLKSLVELFCCILGLLKWIEPPILITFNFVLSGFCQGVEDDILTKYPFKTATATPSLLVIMDATFVHLFSLGSKRSTWLRQDTPSWIDKSGTALRNSHSFNHRHVRETQTCPPTAYRNPSRTATPTDVRHDDVGATSDDHWNWREKKCKKMANKNRENWTYLIGLRIIAFDRIEIWLAVVTTNGIEQII